MSVPIYEPTTIDCSEWNCKNFQDHPEDTGIDFALLASMADRVIIRLAIGLQEDRRAMQIYEGLLPYAEQGEVQIDFYHGVIEWLDDESQAYFFADLLDGLEYVDVMADFERDSSGLSKTELAIIYHGYLTMLAEILLIPLYSIIIYTALWFWDENIGLELVEFFSKFRLMVAHYTLNFDYLLIPSSWRVTGTPFFLHQYSADGNGMAETFGFPGPYPRAIDMGRTNPVYVEPPPPDPVEPSPEPLVMFKVQCIRDVLLRKGHEADSDIIGKVYKGYTIYNVFSVKGNSTYDIRLNIGIGWAALSFKYWYGISHFFKVIE